MRRTDSLEKTLMLGKIKAEGEGDDRQWDGWMASLTQWTWVWIKSGSWWWTGRSGVLWGYEESDMTEWLNQIEGAWNVPLLSLIFLKRSLVFPIILFSSVSLHWSLRKAPCYSLELCKLWLCLFFSPLPLVFLLFLTICKPSLYSHFAFLHFFFLRMVLTTASCTMSWTSIHSSSGTLSDLIPWIYLSLSLYNHKGFD